MDFTPKDVHPRPDFVRADWLSLDGEWDFAFDDGRIGLSAGWMRGDPFDRKITVPFCHQCAMSGIEDKSFHPAMWYRRAFELPDTMKNRRVLLRFGAVDYACRVFVNGIEAGAHIGGYTPFALDITHLLIDGANDLRVYAEDGRSCEQPRGKHSWLDEGFECWYTPVSGIWQTVYLEATGEHYIQSAHVTPDVDAGTAALELTLHEAPDEPVEARCTLSLSGRTIRRQSLLVTEKNQRVVFDMVEGNLRSDFAHWSPDHPALYDLTIELVGHDAVETYFGMRKVEVKGGLVLLNNRPIYQRLILDQGYWPGSLLTPPSGEALRADIEWAMRFGYNGARKHQKIEDPRYYYWADKLGFLVWGELPSFYAFSSAAVEAMSQTLAGFIERDYNHPSLIVWTTLNESWGVHRTYADKRMQGFARMLYWQAKALDGTRPVSGNDGWEMTETDIYAVHDYADDGLALTKRFEGRAPDSIRLFDQRLPLTSDAALGGHEAFLLTEYGGIAFAGDDGAWGYHDKVSDEEAFYARLADTTRAIYALPACQGYCYTQLTDVEQEVNGLLTIDRVPKVDVRRVAAINRGPAGLMKIIE